MTDDADRTAALRGHMAELCALFAALLPDDLIGVALYDDGGLALVEGFDGFPAAIPAGARDALADPEGPGVHVSVALAFAALRGGAATFAVAAEAALASHTLASLSRMGAAFLDRTVGLVEQTLALSQTVRELEAIIDNISDGLIVIDRSGTLRYLNAPGGRILGISPRDSVGRHLAEVLDFEPYITKILETKRGYVDRELQLRSRKVSAHIVDTAVPIVGDDGEIVSVVNTFYEMSRAKKLSNRIAGDQARYRFSDILGKSAAIREAKTVARRAARSSANVLLYGESGTGKEVFAQSIHTESARSSGPFVAVNCAALPRDLIESEMFGYSPGSFTGADKAGRPGRFELASGGTVFLDEISEMPLDMQAKLLRVLQERQVTRIGSAASTPIDVRVIAAANRDLARLVEERAFRGDLYYRLNVMRIDIPPLRERPEDIAELTTATLDRLCAVMHRPRVRLGPRAVSALERSAWPGNIRELQNVLERAVTLSDGNDIDAIPADWLAPVAVAPREMPAPREVMSLDEAERRAVDAAVEACDYNLTRAADVLGISRPTLYAKLKRHGLGANLHALAGARRPGR